MKERRSYELDQGESFIEALSVDGASWVDLMVIMGCNIYVVFRFHFQHFVAHIPRIIQIERDHLVSKENKNSSVSTRPTFTKIHIPVNSLSLVFISVISAASKLSVNSLID